MSSGFEYNLQPREENLYPVSESELESIGSFNLFATILISIGIALAVLAIQTGLNAADPWTATDCVGVYGGAAVSLLAFLWATREVRQKNKLLVRIKTKPKPE